MFCPKCGSVLVPKKHAGRRVMACSSCNYIDKQTVGKIVEEVRKSEQEVEVVAGEVLETLPKTSEECPKCGHGEAYYWTLQTRAGDEPETKFLKCIKCKHTWRDYQ